MAFQLDTFQNDVTTGGLPAFQASPVVPQQVVFELQNVQINSVLQIQSVELLEVMALEVADPEGVVTLEEVDA